MGGSTTVQAAAPLDPAKVGADTLETQLRLAPQVFAANAQYLPQYADLAQQVAGSILPSVLNQQATANTSQRASDIADVQNLAPAALAAWQAANPQLGQAQGQLSSAINAAGSSAPQVGTYTATSPTLGAATQAALPGMAPTVNARAARLGPAAMAAAPGLGAAAQVQGQQAAPSRLLGTLENDAGAALGSISPLQLELQRQAMQQLGGDLTPAQIAKVQQDTRGAYAARGLYDSNQAIGAEILNTDAARAQRQAAAQQLAGQVDAAGQQQIAANRGYAGNVAGMGTQANQFNAGQLQQAGLANQGAVNQFGLTQYGTQAGLNQANAASANQYGLARFGAQNTANLTNAGAANAANQNYFNTAAGLNQANAASANQYGLSQFGADQSNAQFNAQQRSYTDQLNAQLGLQGQQQNIANLFNLANQYAATSQDPYQLVLGRSGAANQAQALGQQAGPTMFDPFNSAITSIYAGNQANQQAANVATANNKATVMSGLFQGIGSILGCWVAQAAYGKENPRWLQFRQWLYRHAPAWFYELYMRDGPAAGQRVAADPALADRVRALMETILNQKETCHGC